MSETAESAPAPGDGSPSDDDPERIEKETPPADSPSDDAPSGEAPAHAAPGPPAGIASVLATALQHEVRTVELYESLLGGAEPLPPAVGPVLEGLLEEARRRTSRLCDALDRTVAPSEASPAEKAIAVAEQPARAPRAEPRPPARATAPASPASPPPAPPIAGMSADLAGFGGFTIGSLRGRPQPPPEGV